jgi:Spy/CpxP family protein refolding chaperone
MVIALRTAAGRYTGLALAGIVALAGLAGPAAAQPEGRGPGMMGGRLGGGFQDMAAPISARQKERYSEALGLTAEQKAAVDALFDGYAEQAREADEQMRAKMEAARNEFRETQDPAVWGKVGDSMAAFRETRKKLDQGFLQDFREVLTPDQAEKWPAVERTHRRDQTLRRGFLSGERVDLVDLVNDSDLPEDVRAALGPVMQEYEADLDRELIRRNDAYEKGFEKLRELREAGDMEGAQAVVEEGREAGVRVRDLNRRYARQIAAALPEDRRPAFEASFKQASFPDVYRPGVVGRSLGAAAGFEDLTAEQKDTITRLSDTYQRSAAALNDKIAAAIEEREQDFRVENMFSRGGANEGPGADLRRERRELDRSTLEALRKALTEEQAQKLPSGEREREGGGDRRRGRRGEGRDDT